MTKKIFLFLAILLNTPVFSQQDATINIVGHASKMVMPDKAMFYINIRASRKTEEESSKAMTALADETLKRLKKEGFTESQIKLTDFSIQPEFEYSTGKAKKTGYISSQSLIVKFPLDKRKILTVYSKLTGNEIEGVSMNLGTECSDSLKNKVQNELIVAALNDAKAKATLIATTTDTKIKSIADVSYKVVSNEPYPQMMSANFAMKSSRDAGTEASDFFSINEIEFNEDIKVSYWIQSVK